MKAAFNVQYIIPVSRMTYWVIKRLEGSCFTKLTFLDYHSFFHSLHWHVQNAMIPYRSQELPPFLSVMYFFLPLFSTNYSSILYQFICHLFLGLPLNLVPEFIYNTLLGIPFSSILCTRPNQRNIFNFIVSVIVGFFNHSINFFIG